MKIVRSKLSIAAEAAFSAAAAAVSHGGGLGKAVVAAVVDSGGDLVALLRADGAFKASIGIATDKAFTAAVFHLSTDALSAEFKDNQVVQNGLALRPGVVLFGGGLPIVVDNEVIGGIGVSGGSEEDDRACAKAGLAALGA